jgi:uncharacterized membrane protein
MMFESFVASDPPLVWLNIMFLMVTALLPFTTGLVGEYRALTVVAVAYGLNLVLAFASAWAIWAYATRGTRLTEEDIEPVLVRGGNRMGLVYVLVMSATTALAFISPILAYAAFAMVVALFIAFTMAGQWESVMIWTTDAPDE